MKEEHLQQSKKVGLVPHQHCKPLFSYLRPGRQEEIRLHGMDMLQIQVPGHYANIRERWKSATDHAIREIQERRKKTRHAIAKKGERLTRFDEYNHTLRALYCKASPPPPP